jgi:hypothetical protein
MSEAKDSCKKRSVSFREPEYPVAHVKTRCSQTFGTLNNEPAKVVILGARGASVFSLVQTAMSESQPAYSDSIDPQFVEDSYAWLSDSGRNVEIIATCGLDTRRGNRLLARWSDIADALIFIFSSAVDSNLQIELLQEICLHPPSNINQQRLCVLIGSDVLPESERDICQSLNALTVNWSLLRGNLMQAVECALTDIRHGGSYIGSPDKLLGDSRDNKSPLLLPILSRGKLRSDTIETSATSSTSCVAIPFRGT